MATGDERDALLDHLQGQVNLVLEHTGRIFAAIAANPTERPYAQISKLKASLPRATDRFHDALDQLESQLQLAALVMRRDLAVSRERAGIQAKPSAPPSQPPTPSIAPPASPIVQEQPLGQTKTDAEQPEPAHAGNDVTMTDRPETNTDEKPVPESDAPPLKTDPVVPSPPPLADAKPRTAAHTLAATTDTKSTTDTLHLDTTQPPPTDSGDPADKPANDEKAPDTANDLDSLFNDPVSADGANDTTTNDFPFEHNGTTDIMDFTNFDANGDNDNISSLLPGLEDYANTQPPAAAGEIDFDSLFNVPGDAANNDAMNSQGAGEQRDTMFDDLMDLANFEGTDADADADGENNNTGGAFDFGDLFK